MYNSLGKHIILEMYGCSFEILNNKKAIIDAFNDAIKKAKMTKEGIQDKQFEPFGVTAVALLSESHMSIHTYPELGYAAADVFTCGEEGDPFLAMDVLLEIIKPKRKNIIYIPRGIDIQEEDINQDAMNILQNYINEKK